MQNAARYRKGTQAVRTDGTQPRETDFRHPPGRKIACPCLFCFCAESRSGARAVKQIFGEYRIGRQSPATISDMSLGRSAVKAPPLIFLI